LFAIARNRLIDEIRRRRRAPAFDPASQSLEDLQLRPSELAVADEQQRALLGALRSIALDQQIALELFYWEAMSGREIAEVLGVSEHTVRSRLSRARAALREHLGELDAASLLGQPDDEPA
jgi:RNA polymerase sigma-70 factor (ECF subfamily)